MQAVMDHHGTLFQFLPLLCGQADRFEPIFRTTEAPCSALIMEGSVPLGRLLATGLSAESMMVEVTHDFETAMKKVHKTDYNLLILDLDLPSVNSQALLQDVRSRRPEVRILALSGRADVAGLVDALEHGADDYLPKPFSLLEMTARVRALRRRINSPTQTMPLKPSSVVLHAGQSRVERDGHLIDLTPREFTLLQYMMQNPGKTLSRALLTQEVWHMPAEGNTNIVDVYMKYLRDKLDGHHDIKLIRTVRGLGYSFQEYAQAG